MEIAIDELPVMFHMHYNIRIYGASVNHVTYFFFCPVIINNSICITPDFSHIADDEVMASIDQKADEKTSITFFLSSSTNDNGN